jgi:hypothetical protein
MFAMFNAVAGSKPKARVRWGWVSVFIAIGGFDRQRSRLCPNDAIQLTMARIYRSLARLSTELFISDRL